MKTTILSCVIAGSFALATGKLFAQSYNVTTTSSTYQELVNATTIPSGATSGFNNISIPYDFKMFGNTYMFNFGQGGQSKDGWVAANGVASTIGKTMAFDGMLADMGPIDATSAVSYAIVGTTGNRILKFQWKNMALNGNPSTDSLNYQLWFHESNYSISIHMGPSNVTSTAAYNGASGPTIGFLIANSSFSNVYKSVYLTGSETAPVVDNSNPFAPLNGTPSNGTVYTLTYGTSSGIADGHQNAGINIYPNPASGGKVKISCNMVNDEAQKIRVVNLGGQVVYEKSLSVFTPELDESLDLSALSPGMYFLQVVGGSGSFNRRLILK